MNENIIITACDKNGVIGLNNKMPWHLPEDLKRFRKLTLNNVVIMGKNTYLSIGKPLDNRINIVISTTLESSSKYDNLFIVKSIDEAINKSKEYNNDNYIIGGGKIYQQFLDLNAIDVIQLTLIKKEYPDGDTFFPVDEIMKSGKYGSWNLKYVQNIKKYNFLTYSKLF